MKTNHALKFINGLGRMPGYAALGNEAIRSGKWKLVTQPTSVDLLLFDLDRDPGERRNLFYEQQDKAKVLRAKLAEWDKEMNQSKPRFSVK